MPEQEILTEDEADERYGAWLPNFWEEGNSVWEHAQVIAAGIPTEHVWTLIDGDEGDALLPGFHIVNRIGYIVTEHPWEHELIEVQLPGPDEEPDGDDD